MKRRFTISALTALTMIALICAVFADPSRRGLGERRRYRGSAILPHLANVPTLRVKGPTMLSP
jgi:hypothetical protein